MESFLGFIVLTSPLFLIVLWVPVCIALAVWVSLRTIKRKSFPLKVVSGLVVFLLAFILPFGDEIAGRIYLNHLCATEAGAKVYQTIELPAEYWDENGKPKFYDLRNGNFYLDLHRLIDGRTQKTKRLFNVVEYTSETIRRSSGNVISRKIWFEFHGGWLLNTFSSTPSGGASCGRNVERTLKEYSEMFIPIQRSSEVNHGNN